MLLHLFIHMITRTHISFSILNMPVCPHVYVHACTQISVHMSAYVSMHMSKCLSIQVCVHACVHTYAHVSYVFAYDFAHVFAHVHFCVHASLVSVRMPSQLSMRTHVATRLIPRHLFDLISREEKGEAAMEHKYGPAVSAHP